MESGRMIPRNRSYIIIVMLIVTCVIVLLRRIFINVHIDEEVIISMGYRTLRGQQFFIQNQEPQLLLAPLIALLEAPYVFLFGTSGIFVYMKLVMCIILICFCVFTYRKIKLETDIFSGIIVAVLCFFFHFKYVKIADYLFLYDTFSVILILQLLTFGQTKKYSMFEVFIIAFSSCIVAISLPSGVLLFPVSMMLLWTKENGKKSCFFVAIICAIMAALELLILFHGHALNQIPELIHSFVSGSTYMKKDMNLWLKLAQSLVILFCLVITLKQHQKISRILQNSKLMRIGGGVWSNTCALWSHDYDKQYRY